MRSTTRRSTRPAQGCTGHASGPSCSTTARSAHGSARSCCTNPTTAAAHEVFDNPSEEYFNFTFDVAGAANYMMLPCNSTFYTDCGRRLKALRLERERERTCARTMTSAGRTPGFCLRVRPNSRRTSCVRDSVLEVHQVRLQPPDEIAPARSLLQCQFPVVRSGHRTETVPRAKRRIARGPRIW